MTETKRVVVHKGRKYYCKGVFYKDDDFIAMVQKGEAFVVSDGFKDNTIDILHRVIHNKRMLTLEQCKEIINAYSKTDQPINATAPNERRTGGEYSRGQEACVSNCHQETQGREASPQALDISQVQPHLLGGCV